MNRFMRFGLTFAFIMSSILTFAQQRSIDEVMSIATEHLQNRIAKNGRKMAPPTEAATTLRASQIVAKPFGMGLGEAFYVLSYPNSHCFVMVSGDKRMSPILAYSNENSFAYEDMAPQAQALIKAYAAQAEALQTGAARKLQFYRALEVTPQKVNQLLTTQWAQRYPFNKRCPVVDDQRTITGCVATAMSQIMNFYKYPKVGIGSISYTTEKNKLPIYIDLSTIYFSWDNMLDSYSSGDYDDEQADAVSNLMFATGASVNMDYGISASSSSLNNAATSFIKHFKYDKDIITIEFNRMSTPTIHQFIMQELIAGRPIPLAGSNKDNEGHAFIIDGMTPDGDNYPFYHINWGWGGLDDGDFKLPDIEYYKDNFMLINCQPENDSIDYASFVQALSLEPSVTKVNPSLTGNFSVRINEVYNSKQGTFNGMLNVYLINSDGTRTKIGERGVQLEHPYFYHYDVPCKVPKETPLGSYRFEVGAQDLTTGVETTLYFAGEGTVTITDEAVDYVPDMQATKMEYVKSQMNDSTVCVSLTTFLNFAAEPFKGDVSLALTSENDKLVCMLGTPIKVSQPYEHFISYSNPLGYLKGVVPDSLPDAIYHLVVMARQEGFEGWGRVKKFDLQGTSIRNAGAELFLNLQIEDHKIKTDNIVVPQKFFADIETTQMTLNEDKCIGRMLSITFADYANLGEETFVGKLSLALADDDNNVIMAFGQPFVVTKLDSYYFRGGPITIEAELPDTVSDGHYRLCIAAQQTGYANWTPVTRTVIEDNSITDSNIESFFDLWVINGRPTTKLFKREDVNHDGIVDTQDVLAIYLFMQQATGNEEYPAEDVNNDGVVDTQDVLTIYNYMQEN